MFFKKSFNYFKKFDWILIIAIIFLVSLGIMTIYGISLGGGEVGLESFKKQILFACMGVITMAVMGVIDYKVLKNYSFLIFSFSVLLLIGVLLIGQTIRGTRGWFIIYGFRFQPVEAAKIGLIIILAKYFSDKIYEPRCLRHIITSGLVAGVSVGITLLQPDFGSAFILCAIWFGMLVIFGIKKLHFFLIMTSVLIAGLSLWFFVLKGYQKDRIFTFLNPASDPLGRGYNITQSLIAIGSGGFKGKGLGSGSQTQLKFLPETKTDFIFSVLAEELGFGLISLMFIGWAIIFYRIYKLAKNANNEFAIFLSLGISILFFVHLFINIGVSTGILPVTGISLPFMSYGGSFLLTCLLALGILQSISARTEKKYFRNV